MKIQKEQRFLIMRIELSLKTEETFLMVGYTSFQRAPMEKAPAIAYGNAEITFSSVSFRASELNV